MHPFADVSASERPSIVLLLLLLDLLYCRLFIPILILLPLIFERKSPEFVPNVREYFIRAVKRSFETPGIAARNAKVRISIYVLYQPSLHNSINPEIYYLPAL